ncbi:Hypothetical_protein [Hexamita inflata]|uniref:Hypothetical_protein n=1 Tax=Hexamita inflata TaxID=28002 RepID=A0AA86PDX1_9EUKA|nr:Hypothetical protein HINF_LOCUS21622 [Hexamita inflata]
MFRIPVYTGNCQNDCFTTAETSGAVLYLKNPLENGQKTILCVDSFFVNGEKNTKIFLCSVFGFVFGLIAVFILLFAVWFNSELFKKEQYIRIGHYDPYT